MLLNISITTTNNNNITKSLRFLAPFLRSESKSFFRIYNPKKDTQKNFRVHQLSSLLSCKDNSNILSFETTG